VARTVGYTAFGVPTVSGGLSIPIGFAGGLEDRLTGLVRFGQRDYDPQTGRWTARDPALLAGRQANLYAYLNGDPVNDRDPTGLGDGPMYPAKPPTPPQPNVCGPEPEQRKAELFQWKLRLLQAQQRALKSDDPKVLKDEHDSFRTWQREYWKVDPYPNAVDGKTPNAQAFSSSGTSGKF
jgi:RHS repeat-associated protein